VAGLPTAATFKSLLLVLPAVSEPVWEFDADALATGLEPFGGDISKRRAVARCARDLADSERYVDDTGIELTPEHVVVQLADAPDEGPVERWNWWIGSLEIAYGGYAEFQLRRLE
jgi:hypothetical protein